MQTIDQLRSGQLTGAQRLKLSCGLKHFPPEIMQLAETLEILDLSGNSLSSLPDELARLKKLRIIFCSDNDFTTLPDILGACPELVMIGFKANRIHTVPAGSLPPKLRWLILTDNRIEALPDEIGGCTQLQKLMLAGNRLQLLPPSLANCQRLELLRISANRLAALPEYLLHLPRLSWLACSGNPFCSPMESQALTVQMERIHWSDMTRGDLLGEGASGIIHQASLQQGPSKSSQVAVKVFKGEVSSDGLPQSEMAASIQAGQHPGLIRVIGKVVDHPENSKALVMDLVSRDFSTLAGPPSLDSCTRDIYPPGAGFTLAQLIRIAHGIASALGHLHQRGIMHGDLYGHNILHDAQGRALIGDFGAASFHATQDSRIAMALQKLEVRAFGCLLEELLERCVDSSPEALLEQLHALKTACLSIPNHNRPDFTRIGSRLQQMLNAF